MRTIHDVVSRHLCAGCGACAYIEPDRYEMVDDPRLGRRPALVADEPADGGLAMKICPGVSLSHDSIGHRHDQLQFELPAWGRVLALWEGHASDPEIRFRGSSGGAATALALYSMEKQGLYGTLHIDRDPNRPFLNRTILSTTRHSLVSATGSRYAPASPCDRLDLIEDSPGKCVFIGKPCDVAAVQAARKLRSGLDQNLGPVIAFFCAGTPSTRGTLDLLAHVGVDDPDSVTDVRYRGNGWPGRWTVHFNTPDGEQTRSLSYEQSWGFLESYRQWRCYICADHTGEFADVAVGDPWYRSPKPDEAGSSLILARTHTGLELVHAAEAAGYLTLRAGTPDLLAASQPNLLAARGRLWGQMATLRTMGVATPNYRNMPTFVIWLRALSFQDKLRSIGGTVRRIFKKRLYRRVEVRRDSWQSSEGRKG